MLSECLVKYGYKKFKVAKGELVINFQVIGDIIFIR